MGKKVNPNIFRTNLQFRYKNYGNVLVKPLILDLGLIICIFKKLWSSMMSLETLYTRTICFLDWFVIYTKNEIKLNFIVDKNLDCVDKLLKSIIFRKYFTYLKFKVNKCIIINFFSLKFSCLNLKFLLTKIKEFIITKRSFRKNIKTFLEPLLKHKTFQGCKLLISGRIGGSLKTRSETIKFGVLSLTTLIIPIKYVQTEIKTTHGIIGIKLWVVVF